MLAATVIMLVAGIWLALQHSISSTVDQNLRSRLTAVRHYLKQQEHEGGDSNLAQEVAEDVDAVAATSLIRIASTTGAWIYRSRGTEPWKLAIPSRETLPLDGRISTIFVENHSIRVLSAPSDIGVVQIGLSLAEFQDMQRLLALTVLLGSLLLVLVASGGGYRLSGRALRPVNGLVPKAQSISAQNLVDRLPSRGTGDELDRLSDTLNGMLAAIMRTTAEVTCANPRTPEEHENAWNVILAQSDLTSQLIDDLLMLARADSDERPCCRELMDATAGVRDTCDEMHVLAEAKGLKLSVHTPPECTMFGDPEDLRRIVLILLDNAIKYTQETGQIVVTLSMGTATERRTVAVSVGDTGIGIPNEDVLHIFDRFYRAAKDGSREAGGAGLGLTIARY
jgi:two-component system heavy metal sensor histidine kinase CusS